jgi:hypothetical protein
MFRTSVRGARFQSAEPVVQGEQDKDFVAAFAPRLSDGPFLDKGCDEGRDKGSQPGLM